MLENPYSSATLPPAGGTDIYRGEGRFEESADGTSIFVWWESTLEESFEAHLRLAEMMGIKKVLRKSQYHCLAAAVLGLVAIGLSFYPPRDLEGFKQGLFTTGCIIAAIFGLAIFQVRPNYLKSLREMVIKSRGTAGVREVLVKIDDQGFHERSAGTTVILSWAIIREVQVTSLGMTLYRDPPAIANIPARVFPNAEALKRFVTLAQKYIKQQPT